MILRGMGGFIDRRRSRVRRAGRRAWSSRGYDGTVQRLDSSVVPLIRGTSLKRLAKALALLLVAFVVQWALSIGAYRALEPGRPWLRAREFVRHERGGGGFFVYPSVRLLIPDFGDTLDIAGHPVQIKAPTSVIAGYRSTIRIWGTAEHPQNTRLRWVEVPGWSRIAGPVDVAAIKASNEFRIIEVAVGWPLPSVRGRVRLQPASPETRSTQSWSNPAYEWAVPVAAWEQRHGSLVYGDLEYPFLPLRPLLWGSLVNTAITAFGISLFVAVSRAVYDFPLGGRRRRRIKASRCVKCGYPLGSLAACPECGCRVHRRPTRERRV